VNRIASIEPLTLRDCRRLAEVTRHGFRDADPVPGLPPPDGLREQAEDVGADARRGARFWVAHDAAGKAVGCVRAIPGDAAWELRRLAVAPESRGLGVARALVRRLEVEARGAGASRVVLDAVVERANPVFYTQVGYSTTAHWPSDDKALSEVTMERGLSEPPRTIVYPWEGDLAPPREGSLVAWFRSRGDIVAVFAPIAGDAFATIGTLVAELGDDAQAFLGADLLPGPHAGPGAVRRRLLGERAHPDNRFLRLRHEDRAYTQPRALEPGALALWRAPGGVSVPTSLVGAAAPAA
jgi:predicted N-acetyltransferase YhbS